MFTYLLCKKKNKIKRNKIKILFIAGWVTAISSLSSRTRLLPLPIFSPFTNVPLYDRSVIMAGLNGSLQNDIYPNDSGTPHMLKYILQTRT